MPSVDFNRVCRSGAGAADKIRSADGKPKTNRQSGRGLLQRRAVDKKRFLSGISKRCGGGRNFFDEKAQQNAVEIHDSAC